MDTSKKYIKMCKEAVEIQKIWDIKVGDFIYRENKKKKEIISCINQIAYWNTTSIDTGESGISEEDCLYGDSSFDAIWLPRQDQLQGIVADNLDTLSQLQGVWIFVNSFKLEPKSMEELWLRYVMWQKYKKDWNREKGKWEVV